ncbi:MAG: type II toxin-antitoxin system RelE/ParE family toxin [Candidatus Thiodiazotropha sp. LLP2]
MKQFDDSFHQLADIPNLGNPCDYIRPDYRNFPVISHVIYYRIASSDCV